MRKTARAIVVALLVLLSSIILCVASTITSAITLATTALIVPGTGTPNADNVSSFKINARDYYLGMTPCSATSAGTCALVGVPYPASLWPVVNTTADGPPGSFDKYGPSVAKGVAQLDGQLFQTLTSTEGPVVVFGFSQGANVVSNELYNLATLDQATKDRLTVVVAGNTQRPNGGIWTRLGLLGFIPILEIPLGKPTPNDIGIKTIDIAYEYDPVGDDPTYPLLPLSSLNALLGLFYIHVTYMAPNGKTSPNELPDGYTAEELAKQMDPLLHPENFQYYGDTTYITIPTKTLPIVRPFLDIASATGTTPIVKPIIDLVSPTLRVLIDLGYDRSINPGVYTPYKLIPIINPVKLTFDLIGAAYQGITDALGGLDGIPSAPIAPLAPADPSTLSTFAAVQPSTTPTQAPKPEPNTTTAGTTATTTTNINNSPGQTTTVKPVAGQSTTVNPSDGQLTPGTENVPAAGLTQSPKLTFATTERPLFRPGNLFTPGATRPVHLPSEANDGQPTPRTTTPPGLGATEAGTTTPANSGTPTGDSPSANSSTGSPGAAAA